ncbi:MAG: hypothetical protein LBT09_00795 [Planctomycetaceae bacterium]|nr:hypothetical protein [Planctomycetaceae bacterium]
MQIHYALYDQSYSNDGNYWTWFDESLPRSALNKFYSDFAAKHLPEKPNDLTDTDLWGGAVAFDGYLVLYRCVNGGYDNRDRPQRCVIITAWLKCADIVGVDLPQIFDSKIFHFTQEHAKEIPVLKPEMLTEEIKSGTSNAAQNVTPQVDDLLLTKEMRFVTGDVVSQALGLISATLIRSASGVRFITADIEKISTQKRAVVRVKLETPPPPPPERKPVEIGETTKKIDKPETAPSPPSQPKKSLLRYILIIAPLVIIAIGGLAYCYCIMFYNKPSLSPQAQQVIILFKQLKQKEQRAVLQELKNIMGNIESGSSVLPDNPVQPTPKK